MSFDISGPGPSRKPIIREAQSMENNGGGGNLGYMQSGRRKKDEEDEFESDFLSSENDEGGDFFKKSSDTDSQESQKNIENTEEKPSLLDKIKNFMNKDKEKSED